MSNKMMWNKSYERIYIYICVCVSVIIEFRSLILQSQAHIVHDICDGSREKRLHQRSQGFRALPRRHHAQGGNGKGACHLSPTCGPIQSPQTQKNCEKNVLKFADVLRDFTMKSGRISGTWSSKYVGIRATSWKFTFPTGIIENCRILMENRSRAKGVRPPWSWVNVAWELRQRYMFSVPSDRLGHWWNSGEACQSEQYSSLN